MAQEQYGIMRTEKRKMQDLYGLEAEANREAGKANNSRFENSDIDDKKTQENYYFIEGHNWKKLIEKKSEENGLKPRKNATLLIDSLYTASPEFFAEKTPEQIEEYFHDCLQFHIREYCNGNADMVINARVHLDEATPHMTLQSLPIFRDKEGKSHYSAKEVLGGKKALSVHQDHFYEQVGMKWGLARGKQLDGKKKAKHKSVQDYKIEQNEKILADQQAQIMSPEQVEELKKQADEAEERRDRANLETEGLMKYNEEAKKREEDRYEILNLNLDRLAPVIEVRTKSLPEDSDLRKEAEQHGEKKIKVNVIDPEVLQMILAEQKKVVDDKENDEKHFRDWERKIHFNVLNLVEQQFWNTGSGQFKKQAIQRANRNAEEKYRKKYQEKEQELKQREWSVSTREAQLEAELNRLPELEDKVNEQAEEISILKKFKKFAVDFCKKHFNFNLEQMWQKYQKARTEAHREAQMAFGQARSETVKTSSRSPETQRTRKKTDRNRNKR